MANPIKIAKVISKATKARDAARKKSYSAAPGAERGKKSSRTSPLPTAGMNRGRRIVQSTPNAKTPPNTKIRRGTRDEGRKLTLVKGMPGTDMFNKKISGSNKSAAKKRLMTSSGKDPIQKHPLVRNTGESSAEGKYRLNRGKPIPAKKRGK